PTGKELAQHALAVEKAGKLPVMLYNYPGRSGAEMDYDFLTRVARHTGFCAIKESSGDINRVHLLAREFPHLQLCCGADDQALEFFVWGARAWVCAAANFLAPETIALYKACVLDGDFALGRRIMKAMLPLMTVLERVLEKVKDWRTGNPLDPANALGAIISKEQFDRILGYIKGAQQEGAKLILGGKPLEIGKGLFIPPTIFDDVTPDMTIAREEVFGP
ncbi:MAG: aldehyde dehydrogenase family protein, partial [Kiritimatiellia bacterium]